MSEFTSRQFIGKNPEECWSKYDKARLSQDYDRDHHPTVSVFWLHENDKYILTIVRGYCHFPNM